MRKFSYSIYWVDMDVTFASFDARNKEEALGIANDIVRRDRFEGTFHVGRTHDRFCRYGTLEFSHGTFRREDYEFDRWNLLSLRRKEK